MTLPEHLDGLKLKAMAAMPFSHRTHDVLLASLPPELVIALLDVAMAAGAEHEGCGNSIAHLQTGVRVPNVPECLVCKALSKLSTISKETR